MTKETADSNGIGPKAKSGCKELKLLSGQALHIDCIQMPGLQEGLTFSQTFRKDFCCVYQTLWLRYISIWQGGVAGLKPKC